MPTIPTLYTDGGARGNPGPAGIGAVLTIGEERYLFKKYIGETTNNQAEYQALILGLDEAIKRGIKEINCFLDSELVVKQLKREYKVKDNDLAIQFVKVWNMMQQIGKVTFTHVPRAENKIADRLVNEVLDEKMKK
jgi:ribonuclease HI